jgi:hypothetical protein
MYTDISHAQGYKLTFLRGSKLLLLDRKTGIGSTKQNPNGIL